MTVRRLKTYAGSQGFVYQYYFVGKRPPVAPDLQAPGDEYIFDVTSDRKRTHPVSIFLPGRSVAEWQESHRRLLSDSEKYAAVKMRLFRAFDEVQNVGAEGRFEVDAKSMEEALSSLGVD